MSSPDFFEVLGPRLKRMTDTFRIPPADGEDLVQDACLTLVRNRAEIRDPEAWLVRTLYRMCCTWYRRQRRRWQHSMDAGILEAIAPAVDPPQGRLEQYLDLRALLAALPRRQRDLVALRYGYGLSSEEIAARLGCRAASVGKLSQRAVNRLRRGLLEDKG